MKCHSKCTGFDIKSFKAHNSRWFAKLTMTKLTDCCSHCSHNTCRNAKEPPKAASAVNENWVIPITRLSAQSFISTQNIDTFPRASLDSCKLTTRTWTQVVRMIPERERQPQFQKSWSGGSGQKGSGRNHIKLRTVLMGTRHMHWHEWAEGQRPLQ